MNKVIILEGPDNIGKTRFAEYLTEKYKGIYSHFGEVKTIAANRKSLSETVKTLKSVDRKLFFFDRSFLGDFVYGPMFRGYDSYTYLHELKKSMENCNTDFFCVFLYADQETYNRFSLDKKKDEKKDFQKREHAEEISIRFWELANKLYGVKNVIRFLVNNNNYESLDERNEYLEKHIVRFIENKNYKLFPVIDYKQTIFNIGSSVIDFEEKRLNWYYEHCEKYEEGCCSIGKDHKGHSPYGTKYNECTVGHGNVTNPRYIFVGEAPGHLGCGTYGIPFYGDKSGYILYESLAELGIILSDIYITNTIKCCPKGNLLGEYINVKKRLELECVRNLKDELESIGGKPKIIALGKVASNTLKELKIKHSMVYHPAYYLRIGKAKLFTEELRKVV